MVADAMREAVTGLLGGLPREVAMDYETTKDRLEQLATMLQMTGSAPIPLRSCRGTSLIFHRHHIVQVHVQEWRVRAYFAAAPQYQISESG